MNKHVMEQALRELDPARLPSMPDQVDEELLARVLTTPEAAAPAPAAGRTRRHAGWALGGAVVAAIGVGAAATAGVLPDRFTEVFPWMANRPPVADDPRFVVAIPGPWGTEIRYFETVANDGTVCLNHVQVDSDADADALLNAKDWTAGGVCGNQDPGTFTVTSMNGGPWYYTVTGTAGEAVTAEVKVSDGSVYPITIADGWLLGWFGAEQDEAAVLTGYDADGQPIRRIQVEDRQ